MMIKRLLSLFGSKEAGVLVTAKPTVGYDTDYRKPDDPEHFIRYKQKAPKGLPRKIVRDVKMTGVQYEGREKLLAEFISGSERRLGLRREPDNEFDSDAIAVIGSWKDAQGREHEEKMGYKATPELRNHTMPIGATLCLMFKPRRGKSPGLRMDIWGPRRSKGAKV